MNQPNQSQPSTKAKAKPKPKPKPIKRRKRLSRNQRGGDRKKSNYDYEGAKEVLSIHPSANDQQIISAITSSTASNTPPPPPPSPDKKAVKRQNKKLKADNEMLKKGRSKDKHKIAEKESAIRDLLRQLWLEKKASNAIIESTMSSAIKIMDEALQLREEAKMFEREIEAKLITEVEQHQEDLRKERQQHTRERARMKDKFEVKLEKQEHEHDESMKEMRAKYENQKVS
jgi:hypothetical protein